jgi:hypothetical protein
MLTINRAAASGSVTKEENQSCRDGPAISFIVK